MSNQLVRKAFETRLKAWAAALSPPLPVAFENAPFTVPADGRYCRGYLLPGKTQSNDLEGVGRVFVGVFQVTLLLPQNRGTADATSMASSLDAAFPTGAPLQQDGLDVWITEPMAPLPPSPNPTAFEVPVSGSYKAVSYPSISN